MSHPALLNYKLGLKKGGQDKSFYATLEKARSLGMGNDTILAHINPKEANELARTRGMMINPRTGLPQFGLLDILGGVLGGIGGFLFGGPAGAVKGFGIGSSLGGAIEGGESKEERGPQGAPMMTPPPPPQIVRRRTLGEPTQYIPGKRSPERGYAPQTQTETNILSLLSPLLSQMSPEHLNALMMQNQMGLEPELYNKGGYVRGGFIDGNSGGQADDVSVDLPQGAYVMDATTVSLLGDGNTKNGVKKIIKEIEEPFLKSGITNDFSPSLTIKAKVSDGEHIIPKEVVTAVGGGNNPRGAKIFDDFRKQLRKDKGIQKFLPPKTKNVMQYIHKSSRKVGGVI